MIHIDWTTIRNIVDIIFAVFGCDVPEEISYEFVTERSYLKNKIGRTLFNSQSNTLYFYDDPDSSDFDKLKALVHECYHIIQKSCGITLEYSPEHARKYGEYPGHPANHMFMFCKYYIFECDAQGYSQAFVLAFLQTIKYCKLGIEIDNIDAEIDKFSKPDYFDQSDVDSQEDYQIVKDNLQKSYDDAKKYFDDKIDDALNTKEWNSLFSSIKGDSETMNALKYNLLYSDTASIIYQLSRLKRYFQ